jgi:carboxylesterase
VNSSDEPPCSLPQIDTRDFFFDGEGLSALLVHGLTGTPYEMRYLGERLARAGVRVRAVRLAGHAGPPEELGAATYENWYESVVEGFEDLRRYGDPNVVIGLSMGAMLSARLAADQREAVSALVMLSPAFFIHLGTTLALKALSWLDPFVYRVYLRNDRGSDIHDQGARLIQPSTRLIPLRAPIEMLRLSDTVRPRLARITQPVLIIHSRQDHTCPCRKNVGYLLEHLGSEDKHATILEESYHVITVDNEKDRVASETIAFASRFRAASRNRTAQG